MRPMLEPSPGLWIESTARLRRLEEVLRSVWRERGFQEVLAPLLLPDAAVEKISPEALRSRTLHAAAGREDFAVRSDFTAAVAWMATRRGNGCSGVQRLWYRGTVVRAPRADSVEEIESYQMGCERISAEPDGDDEVARLAAESLMALNLEGSVLELGHGAMVGPLLDRMAWPADARKALERALDRKSVSSLAELAERYGRTAESDLLAKLIHVGGRSPEVDALRPELRAACLEETWDSLRSLGESLRATFPALAIRLDPTDVRHWSYYSGLTIKAFSPRHPRAVLSGGRYDGLYPALGSAMNACGFAVHLSRLLQEVG
ncbi:MAG: ATP phosphoribosyltransferase regulatory subunit [Planctomycetes bacterium]|nr:ATP phosphoribosyltransferase regulatory subunit [Planctomycetota bacterium]